jgi:hypothetical protein
MMDIASPKIAQLVADARTELKRLGIDTEGKRSDELLNMVREQETIAHDTVRRLEATAPPGVHRLAWAATHEEVSQ